MGIISPPFRQTRVIKARLRDNLTDSIFAFKMFRVYII